MRFNCVTRYDTLSESICARIESELQANNYIKDQNDPELVVVIGGDGTFLMAVHQYMDKLDNIRFIGIHTGTLGFFTDYTDKELDVLFERIYEDNISGKISDDRFRKLSHKFLHLFLFFMKPL